MFRWNHKLTKEEYEYLDKCLNSTMFRWNFEMEEQLEKLKEKFKFHYVQMKPYIHHIDSNFFSAV